MRDAENALDLVRRQREALADRARTPVWYPALFGLAVLALLAVPFVARAASPKVANWAVVLPAVAVLLLQDRLLGLVTGTKLARGTLRAYPSSRPAGIAMLVVVVAGVVGVNLLLGFGQVAFAVLVAVVATGLAVRCLVRQGAAIREDIRAGRAGR
jgi:hypothetical protein